MDLEEFRAFIAVVETGSFLAAATNLNLARATLRRRVDALEARAGVPLLERSARGVVVTEAGSLLASRGRHVLQEASALVASVREIGREPVGVLRCGLPVGLPPHALVPVFGLIHATYPRLAVHLRHIDDPLTDAIDDLDIQIEDNQLTVRGKQKDDPARVYLYRGIAARQFQRSFVLADGIEVIGAALDNGLLAIDLNRPRIESRVRTVPIRKTRDEKHEGRVAIDNVDAPAGE